MNDLSSSGDKHKSVKNARPLPGCDNAAPQATHTMFGYITVRATDRTCKNYFFAFELTDFGFRVARARSGSI